MSELRADEIVQRGELIAHIADHAVAVGATPAEWPGLTYYRFPQPVPSHGDAVASLSICVVVQGRKRVRVDGVDHFYDPFRFFVMTQGLRFEAEILEASPVKPLLSIVLQVPAQVVVDLMAEIRRGPTSLFTTPDCAGSNHTAPRLGPDATGARPARAYVSTIDQNFTGALLRFLRATDVDADRRILAPMYLRELVYRVLRTEQWSALADGAQRQRANNPVAAAIAFMQDSLGQPITVRDVAEHLAMSQSAFAHLFKDATGTAPYQYLKRLRLDRARHLMVDEGCSVSDASTAVGYGSVSHFINEFKRTYGDTPRAYADRVREITPLAVAEATT